MKKLKKIAVWGLSLCLFGGMSALAAACFDEEASSVDSPSSVEEDSSVEDNSSVEDSSSVVQYVNYTITVKDQDGDLYSGVKVTLSKGAESVATGTTNAEGKVSGSLKVGTYEVTLEDLPFGVYTYDDWSGEVEISTTSVALEIVVEDLTANGTSERPYFVVLDGNGEDTLNLPAKTAYYYQVRGVYGRYLIIENSGVELVYNGTTYTPDSQGKIELYLAGDAGDTFAVVYFSLKNTSDSENEVTVKFEFPEGSVDNPIEIELNEGVSYTVEGSDEIYYEWTATADGTVTVTFGAGVTVSLWNGTDSQTNEKGSQSVSLAVEEGETVQITVSASDSSADAVTGEFTVAFAS